MAGKPSSLEFFQAVTGRDVPDFSADPDDPASDSALIRRLNDVLYGDIGANFDARDWDAIMASPNPLLAAEKGLAVMYSDPSYQAVNLAYVVGGNLDPKTGQSRYTAAGVDGTYQQMVDRVGATYSTAYQSTALGQEVKAILNTKNVDAIQSYVSELVDVAAPVLAQNITSAITPAFSVPDDLISWAPADKASFYAERRAQGFSDADIRRTIELVIGVQSNADWQALQMLAEPFMPPETKSAITKPTTTPGGSAVFFVPVNIVSFTPQQKADFYRDRIAEGFTDAQIRATVEAVIGAQSDDDWMALRALVEQTSDVSTTVTPGATTNVTPLLLAVAAAYLLGA